MKVSKQVYRSARAVATLGAMSFLAAAEPLQAGTPGATSKIGVNFSSMSSLKAGSASFPISMRAREDHSGVSSSWDGRLVFSWGSNQDANGSVTDASGKYYPNSSWTVTTVSPEKLAFKPDGLATVGDYYFGSGTSYGSGVTSVVTDSLFADACDVSKQDFSKPPATPSGSDGRSHMSVMPDPAYAENPYPSDLKGNPVSGPSSVYTYRIIIFGVVQRVWVPGVGSISGCDVPGAVPGGGGSLFSRTPARVTVSGYKTSKPIIAGVESGKTLPLSAAAPNPETGALYFRGEEPSVSLDGRIMIWQVGQWPSRKHSELITYIYNPNPGAADGWSGPHSVSDMYYIHGPGNPNGETLVGPNQIPFSKLYPIAAHPFRAPDGTILRKGSFVKGAYPWLSFDSSEIFAGVVNGYTGTARHGFFAIGKLTNWAFENLDGPINTTRGNVKDTPDYYGDPNATPETNPKGYEGKQLDDAYIGYNGYAGWETILTTPMGLSNSMWGGINHTLNSPLPMHPGKRVYSFILSHSARYVEIPLGDFEDGEYLVRYPMNEMLYFNQRIIDQYARANRSPYDVPLDPRKAIDVWDFPDYRQSAVTFDPYRTPDTSGNFVSGTLQGGAQFPFEYNRAKETWNNSRVLVDRFEGIWGNAIYFPPGSSVRGTVQASQLGRALANQAMSGSLWLKPLLNFPGDVVNLLSLQDTFTLTYKNGVGFQITFYGQGGPALTAPFTLKPWQWTHVGFTYSRSGVQIYVDGNPVAAVSDVAAGMLSAVQPGDAQFIVGPTNLTGGSSALMMIDEVSLSAVERTAEEVRVQALMRKVPSNRQTTTPLIAGAEATREIASIPSENPMSAAKVTLGKALFSEKMLSGKQTVSCATCHNPASGFSDGLAVRPGLSRSSMPLANRLFSSAQLWDGSTFSLEDQALVPIQNPLEMDANLNTVIARLNASSTYVAQFKAAFNEAPSAKNLAFALAAYERTIRSGPSPFDQGTLSAAAQAGRGLFFGKARCVSCHSGANFTDEKFRNNGLAPVGQRPDPGLAGITNRASDLYAFKTPSLRHLGLTAPYMHDGRFSNLTEVVEHYNRGGDFAAQGLEPPLEMKPLNLTPDEVSEVVAFLNSLDSGISDGQLPALATTNVGVITPATATVTVTAAPTGSPFPSASAGTGTSFKAGTSVSFFVTGPANTALTITTELVPAGTASQVDKNPTYSGTTDASGRWVSSGFTVTQGGSWTGSVTVGTQNAATSFDVTAAPPPPPPPAPAISSVGYWGVADGKVFLEVKGSNFGSSGNTITLLCNGTVTAHSLSYESATQINVAFPTTTSARTCTVAVTWNGQTSGVPVSVTVPVVSTTPKIAWVNYWGVAGGNVYLEIKGSGFGATGNSVQLVCDGAVVATTISYQSPVQINIAFPTVARERSCYVIVNNGSQTSGSVPVDVP